MYSVKATRKVSEELVGTTYSNGLKVEDDKMEIIVRQDGALREIVTGLIHEGYTVTIEPSIWFDKEMLQKHPAALRAVSDMPMAMEPATPENIGIDLAANVEG